MNSQAVNIVIRRIASDLVALSKLVLEDDAVGVNIKVGRNTLANSTLHDSIARAVEQSGDPVITALFNNYVGYLEWDRPAKYGTQPPIDVLKDWAEKNGIDTDADTLWAISYAIWRDGHQGRPIFATIDREVDNTYQSDWADKLFNSITSDLDNIFND
jgi:hypothetical protein